MRMHRGSAGSSEDRRAFAERAQPLQKRLLRRGKMRFFVRGQLSRRTVLRISDVKKFVRNRVGELIGALVGIHVKHDRWIRIELIHKTVRFRLDQKIDGGVHRRARRKIRPRAREHLLQALRRPCVQRALQRVSSSERCRLRQKRREALVGERVLERRLPLLQPLVTGRREERRPVRVRRMDVALQLEHDAKRRACFALVDPHRIRGRRADG